MRQIKFRGITKDKPNRWVYGDLQTFGGVKITFPTIDGEAYHEYGSRLATIEVIPETVGQLTGHYYLSYAIYEGDRDAAGNVVEFTNGCWSLNGDRPLAGFAFVPVGTIHDKEVQP